ncbi:hypothetical protein DMN91_008671 [Ooceraea biroi]|uniref:FAM86 N-terminal domain-containing protein n=1 Tax=Ooceraea biroi TaxID=2015173 RepID=A0A026W7I3_OOCBI|nr:protein-lysine N-methyltransferase EEF2KMT isoform X1 [Ooceraea biroi]EZA50994.1 hypothetical protein X777_10521 [Ooceraea biroi]RLU18314.1 hypothetical protein DMN91_008671 [Ooceraea biroi]
MASDMSCEVFSISYLTKQFLCITPISKMCFMILDEFKACSFNLDAQKEILNNTVNCDLIKQYPIKTSYQRAFLKSLMQKITESGNEIYDDIYVAYCRLVSLPDSSSVHYRHFLIENGTLSCITLKESTNLISKGSTGLCSWQGALVLSKWCAENMKQLYGKSVLELGCGVGLTGMSVITVCHPKQYIFSDYNPAVLDMLCENVKLNFLESYKQHDLLNTYHASSRLKLRLEFEQSDIRVIELKWEDIDKCTAKDLSQPDVIIGADILYKSDSFNSLTVGLKHLLTSDNYAVFAATIRNENTIAQFLEQLENHGLAFEECASPKQDITIQSIDVPVKILKIFRKI